MRTGSREIVFLGNRARPVRRDDNLTDNFYTIPLVTGIILLEPSMETSHMLPTSITDQQHAGVFHRRLLQYSPVRSTGFRDNLNVVWKCKEILQGVHVAIISPTYLLFAYNSRLHAVVVLTSRTDSWNSSGCELPGNRHNDRCVTMTDVSSKTRQRSA
jgi:hypothetical protein